MDHRKLVLACRPTSGYVSAGAGVSARAALGLAALLLGLCFMTACNQTSDGSLPPSRQPRLATVPELGSYRDAAAQSHGGITWTEVVGGAYAEADSPQARTAVQDAIRRSASELAAVDYAALSVPDFVTATRSLKPDASMFHGQGVEPNAFGTDGTGNSWVLYAWQGPELPQLADRPLVHRWVTVYALYDASHRQVPLLVVTIRGQVYE